MRDTGAAQSLIVRSAVPSDHVFLNNEFVVLGGFPNTVNSYPIETFFLKTRRFKGQVKLAVVDSLPVVGIDCLYANDLASKKEICPFPILTLSSLSGTFDIKPVGVTTRSRAKEVENLDIDLEEIGNQPAMELESRKNFNLDKVDWDSEAFRQAQNREFHPDDDVHGFDFEDITKPFFYRFNNLLYRVSRAKEVPADKTEIKRQLLVPERYREKLLSFAHESSLSGHFGVRKCFQKLADLYFWPGMRQDVKRFVLSCRVCQMVGKPNQKIPKAPLIPIPSVGEPFREVIIDVVGPLPQLH